MNKLDKLKEAAKKLNDEIAALESGCEFVDGDECWFASDCGSVGWQCWGEYDDGTDNFRLSQGNAFKTEAEAEKHLERLKVKGKLRELSKKSEASVGGFDWSDNSQGKHFIEVDDGSVCTDYYLTRKFQSTYYFASKKDAQNAIDTIGEEALIDLIKSGV